MLFVSCFLSCIYLCVYAYNTYYILVQFQKYVLKNNRFFQNTFSAVFQQYLSRGPNHVSKEIDIFHRKVLQRETKYYFKTPTKRTYFNLKIANNN